MCWRGRSVYSIGGGRSARYSALRLSRWVSCFFILFVDDLVFCGMKYACCSDGTRPVIFKIERIDEEE